jgi:MFS family permease
MAGLAVFTAASLAGGLATTDTFLILMRGIQGLGAALVLPAALSTVTSMFPEGAERNKALGIWGGAGALGGTVGLLAGGILATYAGWQYIFFFNVPIGAAALALAPKMVPESHAHSGPRRYDIFGAVSITAALLMFVYAISQAPQAGWAATQTVAMLAAGAVLLGVFLVIETRVAAPLLPLPLFRVRGIAGSNAVGFLLGASWTTFVFLGTLYMQQVLGFSALAAGAAWTMASVTSFALASAGLSQRMVARTSVKRTMAFGMLLIGGSIVWAAQAPPNGSFWHDLALPFFVGGVGTAFSFVPVSIGALAGVTKRDAGVASGLLNTSQNLGGAIGVAVTSSIAAARSHALLQHGVASVAALSGGLQWAMWVCGAMGLAAIPVAFALIRRERPLRRQRLQRRGRRDDLLAAVPAHEPVTAVSRPATCELEALRQGPALRLSRDPAVGAHLGRGRPRPGRVRPPVRHRHHTGRHQLKPGERQPGELALITQLGRDPGRPVGPLKGGHGRIVLSGDVRGDEEAAGRQGVKQRREDLGGLPLIRDVVQDGDEHQRDGLAEVEHLPGHRVGQDGRGLTQVGLDVSGAAIRSGGQQGARVREDQRVVVDVDDARGRRGRLGDFVHVAGGGQPGPDVEELPDARLFRQVADRAAEERAVLTPGDATAWPGGEYLLRHLAVGREVVLAADAVVVHPGRVRLGRVNFRR